MVSASPPCAAQNSISAFVAPKTENQVPGGGLCPLRRIRQDAQINYLSTLSIFPKQTTYLATLPSPKTYWNSLLGSGRVPHVRLSVHGPKTDFSNAFTPCIKMLVVGCCP